MTKQTPLSITREFAQQHPDFSGIIAVENIVPRGRGGRRGTTSRQVRICVSQGKAVMNSGQWGRESVFNGQCAICGQVYFERVIRILYALDPDAGQPIETTFLPCGCSHAAIAPLAWVNACEQCRTQHGLMADDGTSSIDGDVYKVSRPHPGLNKFSCLPVYTIDMREMTLGRAEHSIVYRYGTQEVAMEAIA